MVFKFENFVDCVFDRAKRRPDDVAYRFHTLDGTGSKHLVMEDLAARIRSFAAGLISRNLTGQRVVLALPHGPEFIISLYGCYGQPVRLQCLFPAFAAG